MRSIGSSGFNVEFRLRLRKMIDEELPAIGEGCASYGDRLFSCGLAEQSGGGGNGENMTRAQLPGLLPIT